MSRKEWSRREITRAGLAAIAAGGAGYLLYRSYGDPASVFIGRATDYRADLRTLIETGLKELGIGAMEIRGRTVLLKPNLVEPHEGRAHINTNPAVIRATAEAFLSMGAAKVIVAEGAGHQRDTLLVLERSGLGEVLHEDRIPFIDLNSAPLVEIPNKGWFARLSRLTVASVLLEADFIVSMAKMKTHHWAGVTLSMKNMFGIMPGCVYGWPKNVLHWAGIVESILDINASFKADLAIVDGVVGMEGDGPILGTPIQSGVIVMGRELAAVDATCCRVMGIDPFKIEYLARAHNRQGTISESRIEQRGEQIQSVSCPFRLIETIPAHARIRES